jgi:hypothetical protein
MDREDMREVLTKAGAGKLRFLNVGQEAKMREVGERSALSHAEASNWHAAECSACSLGHTCFTGAQKLGPLDILCVCVKRPICCTGAPALRYCVHAGRADLEHPRRPRRELAGVQLRDGWPGGQVSRVSMHIIVLLVSTLTPTNKMRKKRGRWDRCGQWQQGDTVSSITAHSSERGMHTAAGGDNGIAKV